MKMHPSKHDQVAALTQVKFSLVDPDGKEGFPGEVIAYVTCEINLTRKCLLGLTSSPHR